MGTNLSDHVDRARAQHEALTMVRNGHTVKAAAEAVGVSGMTVYRWVHKAGIRLVRSIGGGNGVSLAQAKRHTARSTAVAMIRQGSTATAAATAVGVSPTTTARWAREEGIELTRGHRGGKAAARAELMDKMADLLEQGVRAIDAAAMIGVGQQTGYSWRDVGIAGLRARAQQLRGHDLGPVLGPLTLVSYLDLHH